MSPTLIAQCAAPFGRPQNRVAQTAIAPPRWLPQLPTVAGAASAASPPLAPRAGPVWCWQPLARVCRGRSNAESPPAPAAQPKRRSRFVPRRLVPRHAEPPATRTACAARMNRAAHAACAGCMPRCCLGHSPRRTAGAHHALSSLWISPKLLPCGPAARRRCRARRGRVESTKHTAYVLTVM